MGGLKKRDQEKFWAVGATVPELGRKSCRSGAISDFAGPIRLHGNTCSREYTAVKYYCRPEAFAILNVVS